MNSFTFIDLFAGIGGIRQAFENVGGQCVFTSEIDKFARKTYSVNYGISEEEIAGDITKIPAQEIPDFDVLLGGFPCQPFSSAGLQQGFEDKIRGTMFFEIVRILKEKNPKAFLLENVKNLLRHKNGETFSIILSVLKELGYTVYYKIIDASYWVPQKRERLYIVGFKDINDFSFGDIKIPSIKPTLIKILHPENGSELPEEPYTFGETAKVSDKYTLRDGTWNWLQSHAEKHKARGNGFGYSICGRNEQARTLSARYGKDGSEILIAKQNGNPRKLTPRECARLMGFKDSFLIPVSDTQAYKQFGNSVVIPVVEAIAKEMIKYI